VNCFCLHWFAKIFSFNKAKNDQPISKSYSLQSTWFDIQTVHLKGQPRAEISVSAKTESNAEIRIWLSAETEITPKVTSDSRPKAKTESACRVTAMDYMFVDFSVDCSSCLSLTAWHSALLGLFTFQKYSHIGFLLVTLYNYKQP